MPYVSRKRLPSCMGTRVIMPAYRSQLSISLPARIEFFHATGVPGHAARRLSYGGFTAAALWRLS